ncbi:hypothetical protein EV667_1691 [Ancylobacter aquaticus]|uniref:Uncharacterized protein n=2 Tax=Ancylobacter aquaticus TaxID=100 RepID=A0A4R1ICK0_ANCAQ|nr:hypothetical protein EV667_1691 [Ancylobacter aquaticus]
MANTRPRRGEKAFRFTAAALMFTVLGAGGVLAQDMLSPGLTPGARKPVPQAPQSGLINDYPTAARADYVFGCMVANGQTRTALEKCSCSIDTIATILPYERYEEAETIMSVGQVAGQQAELFRSTGIFRDIVADLHRAQAEAEVTCFY